MDQIKLILAVIRREQITGEAVCRYTAIHHVIVHYDIEDNNNNNDKPVGFYGPIAPQFRMPPVRISPELRSLHAAGSVRISRRASC